MLVVLRESPFAVASGYYGIESRVMRNHENLPVSSVMVTRKLKRPVAAMWKRIRWVQTTGWVSFWIRDVLSHRVTGHLFDRLGSNLTFYTFTVRTNVGLPGASILGIWAASLGEVVQSYST